MPKWVVKEIDKIRRRFLWHGVSPQEKKLNLVNWDLTCTPKCIGGLGVMNLQIFNQALLMKWLWLWFKPNPALWKPLLRHTVPTVNGIPQCDLFSNTLKQALQFFDISVKFEPGNGANISLWNNNWGHGLLRLELPNLHTYAIDNSISLETAKLTTHISGLFRHNLSPVAEQELNQLHQFLAHTAHT